MAKFYFSQDAKVTIWVTQQFAIEAETEQEAMQIAERFKTEDVATSDMSECIFDTSYNTESHTLLDVQQNEYKPSLELYNKDKMLLGSNMDHVVPDKAFLWQKFMTLWQSVYIHRNEDFEVNLHQTATGMFKKNIRKIETLYPALKNQADDANKWYDSLEDEIVSDYKQKLRVVTPFYDAISRLNKRYIIDKALQKDEKPFGFVLDYLKDVYSLPKSKGWDVAKQILDYYGIDNENPL